MGQEDTQKATEQKMGWDQWQGRVIRAAKVEWGAYAPEHYNELREYWKEAYERGVSPNVAVMNAWKAH